MENFKNPHNIKRQLDTELSAIVAEENKIKEIIECARMDIFDDKNITLIGEFDKQKAIKKNKSLKTIVKIATIAAMLTVVSVLSVFGAEYYQRLYKHIQFEKYESHLEQSDISAPVLNVEDSMQSENAVTQSDNLIVEWGKYVTNGHELYVNATIKSKDGSPIIMEDENHVPITANCKINTIYVTLDGETKKFLANRRYGEDDSTLVDVGFNEFDGNKINQTKIGVACMAVPVSVEDNLSGITFEIRYSNYDVNLEGKEIEFVISNPIIKYQDFEDIGTDATVADLLKGKNPGNDKIYFSKKYPKCYIEDFGFSKEEGFYKSSEYFYMTIVCDEASIDDMKKLALQNIVTGLWSEYEIKELDNEKLLIKYAATIDPAYDSITHGACEPIDTTWEHIEKLKLKLRKAKEASETVLAEGIWSTSFLLETEVIKIDDFCEVIVPAVNNKTSPFTVNHIKLDALELVITGMTREDHDFMQFGYGAPNNPVCTLKDGSIFSLKFGGGGGNSNTGWAQYRYLFENVVAPENIMKIEWHGEIIWEASLP